MKTRLAQRIEQIRPSATMAISAKAKDLSDQGHDVLSFSAGEPDFPTPEHIRDAVASALPDVSGYTTVRGLPALRSAVRDMIKASHSISYDASSEILVNCGAKQSISLALMALVDPGDEVLIPAPYWVSYPEMVKLAGGSPKIIPADPSSGFQLSYDAIMSAVTDKTRAIIINSPSNPSGAVYNEVTLANIAKVVKGKDIAVISDEIYRQLSYDGQCKSILELSAELKDQVVLIDGVSKAYAMTGWRIGFALAPAHVIGAMAKIQGQTTSGAAHASQVAATAALTGDQSCVDDMKAAYVSRRDLMLQLLGKIPNISCPTPSGAFYVFPDFSAYLGKDISSDVELCEYLLDKVKVAAVPGSAFGAPGHLRLSYACSEEHIKSGLARLTEAMAAL